MFDLQEGKLYRLKQMKIFRRQAPVDMEISLLQWIFDREKVLGLGDVVLYLGAKKTAPQEWAHTFLSPHGEVVGQMHGYSRITILEKHDLDGHIYFGDRSWCAKVAANP